MLRQALGWVGGLACHQAPSRTLAVGGHGLPFCMRCSGLYLGSLACVLLLLGLRRWPEPRRWSTWLVALVLLLPTIGDASLGHYVGWGVGPWTRMALGGLAGAAQVWLPLAVVAWRAAPGARRAPAWWLAVGVTALPLLTIGAWASAGLPGAAAWATLGLLSVLGFGAFVACIAAAVLGLLLPAGVRRVRGVWLGATAAATAGALSVLHWMPGHWRNPFVWIKWAERWWAGG